MLCVIDVFCKCPWVVPLKDKKGITITNALQNFVNESSRGIAQSEGQKQNKVWADKGSEFCSRSMKYGYKIME